jgi:hypothetical protein
VSACGTAWVNACALALHSQVSARGAKLGLTTQNARIDPAANLINANIHFLLLQQSPLAVRASYKAAT